MFKQISIVLLLVLPCMAMGQSIEAELNYLSEAQRRGDLTPQQLTERASKIRKMKDEYPVMQWDSLERRVVLDKVITFPGVGKQQAWKRMKEWAALNFNKLDAVVEYEDYESGKLIIEGYVEILHLAAYKTIWGKRIPETSDLHFSMIVTVKDERAKVQFRNLRFKYYVPGYVSGSTYVSPEIYEKSLGYMLPMTSNEPEVWDIYFSLLRNSLQDLNERAPSIERYVRSVSEDYRF